jgi:hypothetical protein
MIKMSGCIAITLSIMLSFGMSFHAFIFILSIILYGFDEYIIAPSILLVYYVFVLLLSLISYREEKENKPSKCGYIILIVLTSLLACLYISALIAVLVIKDYDDIVDILISLYLWKIYDYIIVGLTAFSIYHIVMSILACVGACNTKSKKQNNYVMLDTKI